MKRLLDLVALSAGGWLGWMLGAVVSTFVAYMASVVGMGLGLYAVRRVARRLLP